MKPLIIASLLLLCACSTKIQHDLSERDADEIQSVLSTHGISATPEPDGKGNKWSVAVPQASASDAIRLLRENNLPRREAPGFAEVFGGGSMVPTATEERAKLIQALSGENARMLEQLDGVVSAKVIVVPESRPSAFGPTEPARASVFLKVVAAKATALKARRGELQALVAGSVPGLLADHVALLVDDVNIPAAPMRVETKDRKTAAVVGGAAGLLVALLASALVLSTLRARTLRIRLEAQAPSNEPAAPPAGKPSPKRAA